MLNIIKVSDCHVSFFGCELNTTVSFSSPSSISFEAHTIVHSVVEIIHSGAELISFSESEFHETVCIELIPLYKSEYYITIQDCEFKKTIYTYFSDPKESSESNNSGGAIITLNRLKLNSGIGIYGLTPSSGTNTMPFIKEIRGEFSNQFAGEVLISDAEIGKLSLTGFNSSSNIILNRISTNLLNISDFTNSSGLRIVELTPLNSQSCISMIRSQLGKAFFSRIDLKAFNNITIDDVNISEINTSLITWFTRNKLNHSRLSLTIPLQTKSKDTKDVFQIEARQLTDFLQLQREIFRQLKVVSLREGNVPQALQFQRHEMHYYRLSLKKDKQKAARKILKKHSDDSVFYHLKANFRILSEKFILWSNQSNDHGQTWMKAAGLLIISSFIFYIPLALILSDQLDSSRVATSWNDLSLNLKAIFSEKVSLWFITLNPTHRMNDFFNSKDIQNNIPLSVYFWDIISRIVVSYFIFQTISAFRKFNK